MKKNIIKIAISLVVAGLTFLLCFCDVFPSASLLLTDNIYSKLRNTNRDIIIVGVDEDTLTAYGAFSSWSRDKAADLINFLYSKEGEEPIAVGFDIVFQGDTDETIDKKLADACEGKDSIVAASIVKFKGTINSENEYDTLNIDYVEQPYNLLKDKVTMGYSNSFLSVDGVSRCSVHTLQYNGEQIYSFAYTLANIYSKAKNISIPEIRQSGNGIFRYFYSSMPQEYSHVSLQKVLDGKIPVSEFKNKIVLVGAYAPAMQDEYYATHDIGSKMYGVEIHANIIQAILDGYTAVEVDKLSYSIISAICIFVICLLILLIDNLILSIILPIIVAIGSVVFGRYLVNNGLIIPQIYQIIILALMIVYFIIRKIVVEIKKRKHITDVFNRYMDPKLVTKLSQDELQEINLNGEKRDVSVLFVDIRGFTKMSESMDPTDVVGVLNEYLGHVTNCIFKHNGMLDKFIGDAAMAVFNAPVDQDDYIFQSVATAYDIAKGSQEISKKLLEKFGKTVSYGVGVHCGPAVIGNIGCKTRMDYTAIGDTVNTSSRIEGKSGKGEILISKDVKDKLGDRIRVEDAGSLELKGKALPVQVYRLIGIEGEEDLHYEKD